MNKVVEPTVLIKPLSPRGVSVPVEAVTKAKAVYVETRSRILKGRWPRVQQSIRRP